MRLREATTTFRSLSEAKAASKAQIDYATHLLKQQWIKSPTAKEVASMDQLAIGELISQLKKKRGEAQWYGGGKFKGWKRLGEAVQPTAPDPRQDHVKLVDQTKDRFFWRVKRGSKNVWIIATVDGVIDRDAPTIKGYSGNYLKMNDAKLAWEQVKAGKAESAAEAVEAFRMAKARADKGIKVVKPGLLRRVASRVTSRVSDCPDGSKMVSGKCLQRR